ncbi:MAG TPA: Fic family protein [Nocardioidaceae bacterium]|nr:Fic family protein [Nocardioidaceae bacterium]
MQSFVDLDRLVGAVPSPVVVALSRVDRGQGSEDLFRNQVPDLLTQLAHRARVASVTASSALEGVVVASPARAAAIIDGRATALRTRSEQEFAGYRAALDYLFGSDWRPLNVGLLLHLHRMLFTHTPVPGGHFKESDNLVVDRSPDGSVMVRFRPVAAARTEHVTSELVARYQEALTGRRHHPVLLVGLFVLDLLTIHPFTDGNGRVARVLANALLAECEYGVGRYVSVEQLIAESADGYYQALLASTHGWHERSHDPWPWLEYFVGVVARAYSVLAAGVADGRTAGTKSERVRDHVLHHCSRVFAISDVRAALPGVSDPTIRLVLHQLKSEGQIRPEGTGRSAVWVRTGRTS